MFTEQMQDFFNQEVKPYRIQYEEFMRGEEHSDNQVTPLPTEAQIAEFKHPHKLSNELFRYFNNTEDAQSVIKPLIVRAVYALCFVMHLRHRLDIWDTALSDEELSAAINLQDLVPDDMNPIPTDVILNITKWLHSNQGNYDTKWYRYTAWYYHTESTYSGYSILLEDWANGSSDDPNITKKEVANPEYREYKPEE